VKASDKWPWNSDASGKAGSSEEFQRVALALEANRTPNRPAGALFSSARAGDGVSTAMLGVGREIQRSLGLRALLVELNRLRPCFSERLHLDSNGSVNAILTKSAGLMQSVQKESTGLAFLPAGGDWPGASVSKVACRILQAAEGHFDMVLFDMPPIFESVDTLAAGSAVEDLVVIVRGGRTSSEALSKIRQHAESGGPKIVGSIITMQKRIVPRWLEGWLQG
jgi:Mrp family chromosome partitioning ATPase